METRTYRACASAYAIFGAISAALALLWLVAAWRTDAPWLPLLVPLAGFALVALWLSGFRLTFCADEVACASLFRKERRFTREAVLAVEFVEHTSRHESPYTLRIRLRSGEELRLNAKVFSREAVDRLLALPADADGAARSR